MILLAAALSIAQQLAKLQHTTPDGELQRPSFVVFDRWANHKPRTIFAILWNDEGVRETVAFRVTGAGSLQRLATYGMDVRRVELRDVTGDGIRELLVAEAPGNRATPIEILRWTGRKFEQIGETSDHASFIDIDGDGIPEIVEAGTGEINECDARTGPVFVQKLKRGQFEEDPHPRLVSVDEVSTDQQLYWSVRDSLSTKCTLRVVNKGAKTITLTLRDEDGDAEDPIVVHEGTQSIELPSRCATADVTITGRPGATVLFVLDSR